MNDEQVHDPDDVEYIQKYGLHKIDRLKLEDAADRLFKAADAWSKRREDPTADGGVLMNEMYDAAMYYSSVRLYTMTRFVDVPVPAPVTQ